MKNNKADDLAYEMAKYIAAELPIPTHLMDNLMKEVCADYKKERQGGQSGASKADMGTVQ